jgi:type VI secretion system secreted protein Hcp
MAIFVKFDGVPGEAEDKDHKEWTDVESVSHSVSRSIEPGAEGVRRKRGSTNIGDIVVSRHVDKSSSVLAQRVADGTIIPNVKIEYCNKVGAKEEPYLTYELKDVILTSYSLSSSSGEVPAESISLNFHSLSWKYSGKGGQVPGSYDPTKKGK